MFSSLFRITLTRKNIDNNLASNSITVSPTAHSPSNNDATVFAFNRVEIPDAISDGRISDMFSLPAVRLLMRNLADEFTIRDIDNIVFGNKGCCGEIFM